MYIEQYLQGGSDEEERDSRRSYVLNGKAQWDVTRVDRILAKLAHIPAELRAMAAERNYWRTTAEKCEVLSDFEDELPRHQQVRFPIGMALVLISSDPLGRPSPNSCARWQGSLPFSARFGTPVCLHCHFPLSS